MKPLHIDTEKILFIKTLSQSYVTILILLILFGISLIIRVANFDNLNFIAERQFRSAIIARAYYFESEDSIPYWEKNVALISKENAVTLEPPLTEFITGQLYRLVRSVDLRIPQLLSTLFWLIGGVALFLLAKRVGTSTAALVSVSYYLLIPLGVDVSSSFTPDSLMMMLYVLSILTIVRFYENRKTSRLILAASLSGLAILTRPLISPGLIAAFMALYFFGKQRNLGINRQHLLLYLGVSLVPGFLYYSVTALGGALQTESRFVPELWLTISFWKDWLLTATNAVGLFALIAALIGFALIPNELGRALIAGLSIGYLIFCLVFTFHIRFAAYYHIQLIVIIALAICPLIALLVENVSQPSVSWVWRLPVLLAFFLLIIFNVRQIREFANSNIRYEDPAVAQEIGNLINHSTQVVNVASYYGAPLEYYGELSGAYWPRKSTDVERVLGNAHYERSTTERLEELGFSPEYFVITDFEEFNQHHQDLREFLESSCEMFARSDKFLIYNSCSL